jgi:probable HAF family extracellular repeat protein
MPLMIGTWVQTSIRYEVSDLLTPGPPLALTAVTDVHTVAQSGTGDPVEQAAAYLVAGGLDQALLWTDILPTGPIETYPLSGFVAARAYGSNDVFPSTVVGASIAGTNGGTTSRPVQWSAELTGNGPVVFPLDLGTLGGASGEAWGVDPGGHVVGVAQDDQGRRRAFLWTFGGTDGPPANPQMRDLGTLGGGESRAYRINNGRQVVGWAEAADGTARPFVWLPVAAYGLPAGMNQLDLAGFVGGIAYAIDDAGRVVGGLDRTGAVPAPGIGWDEPSPEGVAVLWDLAAGTTTLLPPLSAATGWTPDAPTYATALHVTALGGLTVVGTSGAVTKGGGAGPRAVIWDPEGSVTDLNHVLDGNTENWHLTHVTGIAASGRLFGQGTHDGAEWAWLAEPHVHVTYSDLLNRLLTEWVASVWGDSRFDGSTGRPSIGFGVPLPGIGPVGPGIDRGTAVAGGALNDLLGALAVARLAGAIRNQSRRRALQNQAVAGLRIADDETVAIILAELHQPG